MKELSLNILDISENSVKAGATLVEITLTESRDTLTISIKDDGCGMDAETLKSVENPFYTTRTTRSVGLGIPLLKMAAEQTGGDVKISSTVDDGKEPKKLWRADKAKTDKREHRTNGTAEDKRSTLTERSAYLIGE